MPLTGSRAGAGPRIDELKQQFGLTYHIDCLERAAKGGYLAGARVLEVGGALPESLVIGHYGAAAWTAVDNRAAYSSMLGGRPVKPRTTALDTESQPAGLGGYVFYDGDAAELPASYRNAFDVVVSIATFEHIADLPRALSGMSAALRPGGVLLSQVGPVWSGWRGHHVFPGHLAPDTDKLDDLLANLIPWQHLIMGPSEMRAWLTQRFGAGFSDRTVQWIYESPRLNRLFYDDYQGIFLTAGFESQELVVNGAGAPAGWRSALPPLLETKYGQGSFTVDSFWWTLHKSRHSPDAD